MAKWKRISESEQVGVNKHEVPPTQPKPKTTETSAICDLHCVNDP